MSNSDCQKKSILFQTISFSSLGSDSNCACQPGCASLCVGVSHRVGVEPF